MASPIQLTGGGFQDFAGNPLANGYLEFTLSTDTNVGGIYVCSGVTVRVQLDAEGNVQESPAQNIWGNDAMSPVSYYRVTGYAANGQPVWGPNNQKITGSGTFELGMWIPNRS